MTTFMMQFTIQFNFQVFQKRFDGSLDFYRTFDEYHNGFGDVHAEFWMGNNLFIFDQACAL